MKTFSLISTALILLVVLIVWLTLFVFYQPPAGVLSAQTTAPNPQITKIDTPAAKAASSSLSQVVSTSLQGTKGTYAVYIKNLKTGETFAQNEHRSFESGSLYKLWIMGTTYQQIQAGILDEDQQLTKSIPSLNAAFGIAPADAEQTSGTISLTVNQALTQMITISHNYAALLLSEKVRISNVRTFIDKSGLNESGPGDPPKTTAADTAKFLEQIYLGKVVNQHYSQKMIELLKGQQLNDGLPKYLNGQVQIAHKTGEIGWFKHDAGIVYKASGDYVIVVLSESESPAGAQDRIAQLSKDVFDYFE